jgi:glycosyltransferase involved in cell wall biosynthesis
MKKLIVGITAEGSVNLLLGQLDYFKSLGYKTYLLGPYSERSADFCKKEGCEHLVIKIEREIAPLKDLKTLWAILKIFRKVKPDIINLGTPKVSLLGMIAGFMTGVEKRIYTCRGFRFETEKGLKRKILIGMDKITSSLAHKVICISPSLKEYAIDKNIFDKTKTFVINKGSSNGIDLYKFSQDNVDKSKRNIFLDQNNLNDKFIYGFVGRLRKDKGIFELLTVFEKLYLKNKGISLILLGSDITSSLEDKKKLEKYRNHPGIYFLGFKNDIELYISMFDVFVLPTYREGFGNAFIQAAALGVPCIGVDIIGAKDAIENDFNGFTIPPKNIESLELGMLKMLNNSDLMKEYSENGVKWAQNFDRKIIWDLMQELYQK